MTHLLLENVGCTEWSPIQSLMRRHRNSRKPYPLIHLQSQIQSLCVGIVKSFYMSLGGSSLSYQATKRALQETISQLSVSAIKPLRRHYRLLGVVS